MASIRHVPWWQWRRRHFERITGEEIARQVIGISTRPACPICGAPFRSEGYSVRHAPTCAVRLSWALLFPELRQP